MFMQSDTAEFFTVDILSNAETELDLAITMIQDMSFRSPPYSAFGSKINPTLSIVEAGPRVTKTVLVG